MKTLKLSLLTLALISTSIYAQTADEIANKVILAMGGAEKLNSIKSFSVTGKVNYGGMEIPFKNYIKNNTMIRSEALFQGMTMLQVYNGKEGWSYNPMMGAKEVAKMNEEEIKQVKEQSKFSGELFDYKSSGCTLEFIAKEDLEGTEIYKLKLTKKNSDVIYYFIDTESNQPIKQTTKTKFEDKEIEAETYLSNYQTVDGFTSAFNTDVKANGQVVSSIKYDKVEVNPILEDKFFEKPEIK